MLTRGATTPAPKKRRSSVIDSPVERNAARIALTLAPGSACRMIAHAPATCGAALDVPLSSWYPPPGTDEVISSQGANSDMNDAALEKYETLLLLSVEPTLIADEMHAGDDSALPARLLPAATTVATPIARRLSMAGFSGSPSHCVVKVAPPRLMLAETTLSVPATA